jgi:hypothetical protein
MMREFISHLNLGEEALDGVIWLPRISGLEAVMWPRWMSVF